VTGDLRGSYAVSTPQAYGQTLLLAA
jgi:hypothetical protein